MKLSLNIYFFNKSKQAKFLLLFRLYNRILVLTVILVTKVAKFITTSTIHCITFNLLFYLKLAPWTFFLQIFILELNIFRNILNRFDNIN